MLFPMVSIEFPPTDYCLKARPWFILLLVIQLALCVGRFMVNDIWGALTLVMVTLVGTFVVSGECGVNVMNCMYYAMMAFTCGVFDTFLCVMYFQNSEHGFMSKKASEMALLAQAVFLLSPIVEFASGMLAWSFFSDCRRQAEEAPLLPGPGGAGLSGGVPAYMTPDPESRDMQRAAAERRAGQQPDFRAFQGQGRTLADN